MTWKAFSGSPWQTKLGGPIFFSLWLILAARNVFEKIWQLGGKCCPFFVWFSNFFKFLQTYFSRPIPIRMRKKLAHRVQFVMDYQKMPFRSTNFITLHGLLYMKLQFTFRKEVKRINKSFFTQFNSRPCNVIKLVDLKGIFW